LVGARSGAVMDETMEVPENAPLSGEFLEL
jgi:hypothetical protein